MLFLEFPETKNQFPREGWCSLKLSLESKILNEIGQLVGKRGGGNGSKLLKVIPWFCTAHLLLHITRWPP